jgi:hypothetical protein
MIKIKAILSHRKYESWPSYQLVNEWEDFFSKNLYVPVKIIGLIDRLWYKFIKILNFVFILDLINRIRQPKQFYLYHVMSASNPYLISYNNNVIPIIIDFFLEKQELQSFYNKFKNSKALLISSLEVIDFLYENNCPIPIFHFPLSLPDKYQQLKIKKNYQILLSGRQNEVLKSFLNKYLTEFPEVEVLSESETEKFVYSSNKKGTIGKFNERNDFFRLLCESRISFYSTPGLDEGVIRSKGFNQVTPKYLELLAADVKIIARYPYNKETIFYELQKICPNIDNYIQFRSLLMLYLQNDRDNNYENILNKHFTSQRVIELSNIISKI